MGFGSTAKKLQKVADLADDLYTKVNDLKTQLQSLQGTVETTNERVDDIDQELAEQRALLDALAEQQGIDTEAVLEDAGETVDAGENTDTEETADTEANATTPETEDPTDTSA